MGLNDPRFAHAKTTHAAILAQSTRPRAHEETPEAVGVATAAHQTGNPAFIAGNANLAERQEQQRRQREADHAAAIARHEAFAASHGKSPHSNQIDRWLDVVAAAARQKGD